MPADMVPTCEIRIELDGVKPPIWRAVLVPADINLEDFHYIIQTAMGWTNSHLHEFRKGKVHYGRIDVDSEEFDNDLEDEGEYCIAELLNHPKAKIRYCYDFGDDWSHTVTLVRIIPESCSAPRCVDGQRACPPEDCGGPHGYESLLEILADPEHEEYRDMMAWYAAMTPEGHDPEVFPIDAVNKQLAVGVDALVDRYLDAEEGYGDEDDALDEDEHDGDEKVIQFHPGKN